MLWTLMQRDQQDARVEENSVCSWAEYAQDHIILHLNVMLNNKQTDSAGHLYSSRMYTGCCMWDNVQS